MAKKKWKDYQAYLKSDEWKKLRQKIIDRVSEESGCGGICEVCESDENLQVHHWKYPKDWNDDKTEYHVLLCGECHKEAHDIFETINFKNRETFLTTFLRKKYFDAEEEKIELWNILRILAPTTDFHLNMKYNYRGRGCNTLCIKNYSIMPPLIDELIKLSAKYKKEL